MHVRMVRQRRAPGVQHQRRADARAQVLGVGRDGLQHLGRHVEQQPIDEMTALFWYAMSAMGAGSVKTTW